MSTRKRFARLDPFRGKSRRNLVGRTRRTLHVERLEDRRLMSADNPLAGGLADADASSTVAVPASDAPAADAPETFQSREELRQWLIQIADQQWGDLFGQTRNWWGHNYWLDGDGDMMLFRTMLASGAGAVTTNDASSTNVQVAGVDEADLVETDGEYLYIISGKDLVIVKAGVGDELEIASRVRLDRHVTGMYLDGDRLALVSTEPQVEYDFRGVFRVPVLAIGSLIDVDVPVSDDVTDQEPVQRHKPKTTVTVLDVTDRTSPALVQTTEFDGRLVTSRTVDGQLRLVIANDFSLPEPIARRVTDPVDLSPNAAKRIAEPSLGGGLMTTALWLGDYYSWQGEEYVYETREEYIDRVIDAMLDDLPNVRELSIDGDVVAEAALVTPEGIYRPEGLEIGSLTTVATIDMHGSGKVVGKASVIAGQNATVYATQDHLYVFSQPSRIWNAQDWNLGYQAPATNIWKFGFDAASHDVRLAARGKVDGVLLNQFAADEHEGHLRVVTSAGAWGQGQQLFVLQQAGNRLSVVGQIDDIAPGENLHSVRFMGDRAFAVTFLQVDPLFAIDLSDPTHPIVAGELKIPGYSDYLQPLDANHLIGIGRGADEANGQFQEMQISIFDVADLADPQLIHRYSFGGGRSTASVATGDRWTIGDGDHHAVSYFASEQILAVPIFTADNWSWSGETGDEPIFEVGQGGLQVFHVDVSGGLQPTALIEHDTLISRAVRVGDHLYALSPGTVTVHSLEQPDVQLGELAIGADASDAPTPLRTFVVETLATQVAADLVVKGDKEDVAWVAVATSSVSSGMSSLASQDKFGRAAAIEQLAQARVFGDVLVPRYFDGPAANAFNAVDQAFEESADESKDDAEQDCAFGEAAIASAMGGKYG